MTERAWPQRLLLLALALGLLLGAAACEAADMQLIQEFAEEWARSKNIHPANEDGTPNLTGIANITSRSLGGSTGDEVADAAIDAALVIQKIQEADRLATEGYKEGDVGKIDKAIAMRPNDFTYRNTRGAILLDQGNGSAATATFQASDELAAKQGRRAQELNLRDRLSTISSRLVFAGGTGASPATMQTQYCSDARAYQQLTGDGAWLSRGGCGN